MFNKRSLWPLRIVFAAMLAASFRPATANTITKNDASRLLGLHGKLTDLQLGITTITKSVILSTGISREVFCLMDVSVQLNGIDPNLYPTFFIAEFSSLMTDAFDEQTTVSLAFRPFQALSDAFVHARDEINQIFGRCRQYRLVYDQAKVLMTLVEEAQQVVSPILRRVEAAKLPL